MYLTPDTTAILVADRRSALEAAARRRQSLLTTLREALTPSRAVTAPVRLPDGRTPSDTPARAA